MGLVILQTLSEILPEYNDYLRLSNNKYTFNTIRRKNVHYYYYIQTH